MLRLYFDTNVFKDLANNYSDLADRLFQNLENERIIIFYSFAHIQDLSRDKTDHKMEDLIDMQRYVHDNFLKYDGIEGRVDYQLVSPQVAYTCYEGETDLANIFKLPGISFDDLSSIKIPFTLGLDKVPDSAKVEKLYRSIGIKEGEYSMNEIIPMIDKLFRSLYESPDFGKNLRRAGTEMYDYNKLNNANTIQEIDQVFKETGFNMSLLEIVALTTKIMKQQGLPWSDFQEWQTMYMMLSMCLPKDEKNKSFKYSNVHSDADHCCYATYCEYLVTSDQGLLNKSKLLYNHFGASTKSIKPGQLYHILDELNQNFNVDLIHTISNLDQEKIEHVADQVAYPIQYPLYGCFNYCNIYMVDSRKHITFYKTSRYGIIYKEVESVVNQMAKNWNQDNDGNTSFTSKDLESIRSKEWFGRMWNSETITMLLDIDFKVLRLQLTLVYHDNPTKN